MKPFSELSAEELAMENLFIRWVRFPDDQAIRTFWEGWISKYPSRRDTVEAARQLVLMASDWKPESLSNQDVNNLWNRIRSSIEMMTERDTKRVDKKPRGGDLLRGLILVLMSVTFLFFLFYFIFSNL